MVSITEVSSGPLSQYELTHSSECTKRGLIPTILLLSIMGEGCGVPDTGVEMGVFISSIMFMIFSGTFVASQQVSCHRGSLELSNSADYKSRRNKIKDKGALFEEMTKAASNSISIDVLRLATRSGGSESNSATV